MIQHVALEVPRTAAGEEVEFWALLGFSRVEVPQSLRERAVFVGRGATQIHLMFSTSPVIPGLGHVAVVVEDYEAAVAALLAAGHGHEARAQHWGAARGYTRTPAGHRVEVMAGVPSG